VQVFGISVQTQLGSGVFALADKGWIVLAVLVAITAMVLPFVRYGLLVLALGCLQLDYRPGWLGRAFRWAILLDRWAMPEVFLIACAVGYARIAAEAGIIEVGAGGYCFVGVALMAMLSRALLDRRTVWRAIAPERDPPPNTPVLSCTVCDLVLPLSAEGRQCPRCGLKLRARWPGAWTRTLALVIAAGLLYIPANILPMSVTHYPGRVQSYRIIDGVMELFGAGLWPLGVLLSCTSIGIPVVKLAGLGWCLLSVRRRSTRHLRLKTQLYRMIDEAGRWSNIDPFIIAVIVPLMHLRNFVSTDAGTGATAFIAVVALTMTASRGFDPRLMWDCAQESRHERG
jgi:paraquat-inducible protein A